MNNVISKFTSIFKLIKKNDTIILGPYVGEFGWELMEWLPYVEKFKKRYNRIVAISYKNSEYFYKDIEFFPHDLKLEQSSFGFGNINNIEKKNIIMKCANHFNLVKYDTFSPFDLNKVTKFLLRGKKYIKYYEKIDNNEQFDLVFHFRDFKRTDGNIKNYPKNEIDYICNVFIEKGYKIACIGHPELSYCPDNVPDYRSEEIQKAIAVISASKLVIGGSSAPMHLAALCGRPIVTWIGAEFGAERYLSYWNPFNVPVWIVSDKTFRPDKELIIKKVLEAINRLKIR